MIVDERFMTFINSLGQENTPLLSEIEAEARCAHVPVIRKETQGLLKLLLAMSCPKRILEVGAAVGFRRFSWSNTILWHARLLP